MIQVQFDKAAFAQSVRRLEQLTGKTTREVLREQAGFLCADALKLMPPTGNAPMHEGAAAQKRQGIAATTGDIRKVFAPIRRLELEQADNKFMRAINKLMAKGDYHTVEVLLRKIGFSNFIGVIPETERSLHDRLRNRRGRVNRSRNAYFVDKTVSIGRYIRERIKKVGYAKSGWMKALGATRGALISARTRVPQWISGQSGPGIYFETGSVQKPEIQAGNAVPYVQWTAGRVLGRALQERMEKLPRQIRQIERYYQNKLQKAA